MKKYLNLALAVGIIILALSVLIKPQSNPNQEGSPMPTPNNSASPSAGQYQQAEQVLEEGREYSVTLTTSEGELVIKLDTINTPKTANNFAFLSEQGFYDGTIFHRVIKEFMIQGGDPTGTGSGSPGYKFADEYLEGEYRRGTVAMANSGPDSNGSQFFIIHQDYPLPNQYVIFGTVTKGLDVLDKIATAEVKPNLSGEMSSPTHPVTIESAKVNLL